MHLLISAISTFGLKYTGLMYYPSTIPHNDHKDDIYQNKELVPKIMFSLKYKIFKSDGLVRKDYNERK